MVGLLISIGLFIITLSWLILDTIKEEREVLKYKQSLEEKYKKAKETRNKTVTSLPKLPAKSKVRQIEYKPIKPEIEIISIEKGADHDS